MDLDRRSVMLAALRSSNFVCRWDFWSSKLYEKTMMSSKYKSANCHFLVVRIVSMTLWYVASAFLSPNGMRINAYVLKCVVNIV